MQYLLARSITSKCTSFPSKVLRALKKFIEQLFFTAGEDVSTATTADNTLTKYSAIRQRVRFCTLLAAPTKPTHHLAYYD